MIGGSLVFLMVLVAMISGLMLSGNPHRPGHVRLLGVLLIVLAGADAVALVNLDHGCLDTDDFTATCSNAWTLGGFLVATAAALLVTAGAAALARRSTQRR